MKKESCYFFASVSKSFKTDGTVIIKNNNGLKEINIEEPLFIEFDNIMVPFFLEEFEYRNDNSALAKFETINSESATKSYIGKGIYIEKKKDSMSISEIESMVGFDLYDKNNNLIGPITDYQDIPGNPVIITEHNHTEIFIPFNEDLIIEVKSKKGIIRMDIPDGLIPED